MPFGTDDMQATGREHLIVPLLPIGTQLGHAGLVEFPGLGLLYLEVAAEHDVRTTAGHVGGDGDSTRATRQRHDECFTFVLLGIQHFMGNTFLAQQGRQFFGSFDGSRTDQHRLFALEAVADILDDGRELVLLTEVDEVGVILAHRRTVSRNDHDFQSINLLELEGFSVRGAGHAGQFAVHAEVVLEGDGSNRLVFLADAHALLRFHRLVQTIRPTPTGHGAAGEFIDDDDFAVAHDVLDVAPVQRMRTQCGA